MAPKRNFTNNFVLMVLEIAAMEMITRASSADVVSPDCQEMCGNVTIPYPFGLSKGCYLDSPYFKITCNTTYDPPKPFLWSSTSVELIDINLEGELRIYTFVGADCYDQSGTINRKTIAWTSTTAFSFSSRNRFTAIGCDTNAVVEIPDTGDASGCMLRCSSIESVTEGSCEGIGCCQTAIPKQLQEYNISVSSSYNHTKVWSFNPCSYVFIGEENSFNFSLVDLKNMTQTRVPTVIDWSVWNQRCEVAKENSSTYACKANNSKCYQPENINGYRCNCSTGYQGNPYLPNGCTDINECKKPENTRCVNISTCVNTQGGYTCSCPQGYHGDGRDDGEGCIPDPSRSDQSLVVKITVGVGVATVVLLFIIGFLYVGWKKRNFIRLKEKYFQQNGGLMLLQQLRERDGSSSSVAKIFTAKELEKSTNNFDESRVVGQGGYGTVYKGILPNNMVVAIKKSKLMDRSQMEQFINEVIVLSQINHRNVVRLLGCCLETEVPLLVYEFVNNGTLFDHIHNQTKTSKMSWETRLRIAAETAGVLSYLHSAASVPIIHRDIKSTNILMDHNLTAKVSDFGASRLVPMDHAELSTMVQGTLGYLDPEYLQTSTLTEKSDVYSFGVVLVELLTGRKALSFDKPEVEKNLALYFLSSLKQDRLLHIVEDVIVKESKPQQLKEVADLAKRCLRMRGEERPSMKEVAMELEGLRVMNHPWVTVELDSEQRVDLLGEITIDPLVYELESTGYDSMRNQVIPPATGGR